MGEASVRVARGLAAFVAGFFRPAPCGDGFGQTLLEDARYLLRFRRCRRVRVSWAAPSAGEKAPHDVHPIIGRFGDDSVAVAVVDGRQWIVRERIWHGFPDPPEFVFFAVEDGRIWAAADFHYWPGVWRRPQAPPAEQ